ncbi:MAG: amidohydrolase [Phototrophicales bacterium]|nr:MAG: amidohydrolase [Phototrophicales bacterium]
MIDQILYNATIYTQNPQQPDASALAIWGDRIIAVGSDDEILPLANSHTVKINLSGRRILPGLTDAHLHWHAYARKLQAVDLVDVPTKEEALHRVAERAKTTPPDQWIFGIGWRKDIWKDKQFPTAADLDAVIPDRLVYLVDRSGHAAWVNSFTLRQAGLLDNIPDPVGGSFVRDEHGKPSGVLLEAPAMRYVSELMPPETAPMIAEWMREAQQNALKMGLTGFHDFDRPICLEALQLLREADELALRVVKQINVPYIEHAYQLGIRSGFGDNWLRIGGLKIFADGALGPQTALMVEPYLNSNNYGIAVTDKKEMHELVSAASQHGLLATIHAIGDRAVHDVLDVFEAVRAQEAQQNIPRTARRHRIEHVQITLPEDAPRLAQLDIIASMQPIHATSDYELADRYWGERARYSYALRTQLEAGARLALGSDAPLDDINPWAGIHAAVTRRRVDGTPSKEGWYPSQKISLHDAIRGYTQGPAYAAMQEHQLGMLAPRYLADLIVLEQDIFTIEPMALAQTKVLGTMVGGIWRYREFE